MNYKKIVCAGAFGSFLLYAHPIIGQDGPDGQKTAVIQKTKTPSASRQIEEIFKNTYWGADMHPSGLVEDVPTLRELPPDEVVPISVKYLKEGTLDQRKTAYVTLNWLSENVPEDLCGEIVNQYGREHDDWLKEKLSFTVEEVLKPEGRAPKLARYYAVMLNSLDEDIREMSADALAHTSLVSPVNYDRILTALGKEKNDLIKEELEVAFCNILKTDAASAIKAARLTDDKRRLDGIANLSFFHYGNPEAKQYIDALIEDRSRPAVERINAVANLGDPASQIQCILKIFTSELEDPNLASSVMEQGMGRYVRYLKVRTEPEGEIKEFESIYESLTGFAKTCKNLQLKAQVKEELMKDRVTGHMSSERIIYNDKNEAVGTEPHAYDYFLPGRCISGHLAAGYLRKAQKAETTDDRESFAKKGVYYLKGLSDDALKDIAAFCEDDEGKLSKLLEKLYPDDPSAKKEASYLQAVEKGDTAFHGLFEGLESTEAKE